LDATFVDANTPLRVVPPSHQMNVNDDYLVVAIIVSILYQPLANQIVMTQLLVWM